MPDSLFVLIGRTAVLMRHNAAAYWAAVGIALVAEALIVGYLPGPRGFLIANGTVVAVLQAFVYAKIVAENAAADGEPPPFDVASRVLERSWAVIVIDFLAAFAEIGVGRAAGNPGDVAGDLASLALIAFGGLFLVGDVSATIDDGGNLLTLVPRSIYRSVRFFLSSNFMRALVLVAVSYLVWELADVLAAWAFNDAESPYAFWTELALGTIVTPPIAALTALVYRDAQRAHE